MKIISPITYNIALYRGEKNSATASCVFDANGKRYAVFEDEMMWLEAEQFCEDRGGKLVSINSAEEQETIETMLAGCTEKDYWIGLKSAQAGSLGVLTKWMDGTNAKAYSSWGEGAFDTGVLNCSGYLSREQDYDWMLDNGFIKKSFICEWDGFGIHVKYYLNYDEGDVTRKTVWSTMDSGGLLSLIGALSEPDEPTRYGWTFMGWYTNPKCTGKEWDFENDRVTSSMALYAKWKRDFTIGTDTVHFGNTGDYLGKYPIGNYVPYTFYDEIIEERTRTGSAIAEHTGVTVQAFQSVSNGLCFGTSLFMLMNYYGYIDLDYFGYDSIHDITDPKSDDKLMRALCELMLLQKSDYLVGSMDTTSDFDAYNDAVDDFTSNELAVRLVKKLQKNEQVVVAFELLDETGSKGRHAVLAYSVEKITSGEDTGKYYVHIADPNVMHRDRDSVLVLDSHGNICSYYYKPIGNGTKIIQDMQSIIGLFYDPDGVLHYNFNFVKESPDIEYMSSSSYSAFSTSEPENEEYGMPNWIYTDCENFTVTSHDGTETVTLIDGEPNDYERLIPRGAIGSIGMFELPMWDGGYTVTFTSETPITAGFYLDDNTRKCVQLSAESGFSVTVGDDFELNVTGMTGETKIDTFWCDDDTEDYYADDTYMTVTATSGAFSLGYEYGHLMLEAENTFTGTEVSLMRIDGTVSEKIDDAKTIDMEKTRPFLTVSLRL